MVPSWKRALRPLYVPLFDRSATAQMMLYLAKPQMTRDEAFVHEGYNDTWDGYRALLERSNTLEEWLYVKGFDDVDTTWFADGRVQRSAFDANGYYVDEIEKIIRAQFPNARSLTEYGCGAGRIILDVKKRFPEMECYGYDLCEAGVEVSRAAAAKFGMDVKFSQLDYIRDPESKYVHPKTDLAITVFSLEQIPHASPVALKNFLDHTNVATIHAEPVPENYPHNYWGVMGRIYTKRVDYLQNFDAATRALPTSDVSFRTMPKSHNPLIPAPSLYVLTK